MSDLQLSFNSLSPELFVTVYTVHQKSITATPISRNSGAQEYSFLKIWQKIL